MRRWAVVTLLLGLVGCGGSEAVPTEPEHARISSPREIVLAYGEDRFLDGTVLRLSFGQVLEDSRCPVDVVCVWEGNARVEIGIGAGMGPTHPIQLNTALEPGAVVWSGVLVTLLEVTPAPRSDSRIDLKDYGVKLRLEPSG
jgi:hypothetical protein